MGRDLYDSSAQARELFAQADDILGFSLSDTMFNGSAEDLRATRVTQPAVFLHSVCAAICDETLPKPDMVGGHSLGEFSALVACGALQFADALRLVSVRAGAMQTCCESVSGTMAAIIGLADEQVEQICSKIDGIVVPANYNCPGQIVISGELAAVQQACEELKAAGAKRALPLSVGGAFHSPLMEPARVELAKAIEEVEMHAPICPIFQNVNAQAETDPARIKANLLAQLTSPVLWTQTVRNMVAAGATEFKEFGPGNVLQGLIKRIVG